MSVSMKTKGQMKSKRPAQNHSNHSLLMQKTQKDILSFLDSHAQEQIQFVIDLCHQNSYSYNKKGVDRTAEMVLEPLRSLMPVHQVIHQVETGNHHLLKNKNSAKAIYLVGHLDTVFPPDHSFQKCRLQADYLHGPGAGDMKGGLAVFIYALKALEEVGLMDRLNLTLILNGDEELGSIFSRSIFLEERKKALACLVGECAGSKGEIVVSRNGKMGVKVDSFGQDRHVGFGTHEKSSAVLELSHKIIALESLNASLPGVSINAGQIEGGLGPSTVAGHASSLVDIRWEKEDHREILWEKIQEEISRPSQPGCRSEITILNSRPSMPLKKGAEKMFRLIHQVGLDLGQIIKKQHRRGTSDANFFGAAGVSTLDGLGPICEKDHTPSEFIKVSSLKQRSCLLALFLVEYGQRIGMI